MMHKKLDIIVTAIDDCLPQTQCRECGYDACLPYAKAVATGETTIDRCAPGGMKTLDTMAQLMSIDPTPYREQVEANTRQPNVVVIDEERCIGCTKCIKACPVDAIMGASKVMHTVIADECTGCQLCIAPCPMDCITIKPIAQPSAAKQALQAAKARQRYQQRDRRLQRLKQQRRKKHIAAKQAHHALPQKTEIINARQHYIKQAINRVKAKRKQGIPHE